MAAEQNTNKGDKPVVDLIHRGVKRPNLPGTLTFVGLRALDPFLQYQMIAGGWGNKILSKLGVECLPLGASAAAVTGFSFLDTVAPGLPLPHLILLGASAGSAAKQIYWLTALSAEEFPPFAAVAVSALNSTINSLNSLLIISASTSVLSGSPEMVLGLDVPYQVLAAGALFVAGVAVETVAEMQRKAFKDRPENEGKVMKSGLWGWARHINYGGYVLWRGASSMAASGLVGGVGMAVFQFCDFAFRAVPVLDDYCAKRYGPQWTQFKKDVPSAILPGVY